MEKQELMKMFYRENTEAFFVKANKSGLMYQSSLKGEEIKFNIPMTDIQDGVFENKMLAKHLSRWMLVKE